MSIKKPVLEVPHVDRKHCPVCGQVTYSRDGIHPQCAVQQADAPRRARLQEEKKKDAKIKKPRQRSWNKKCPKCHTEIHIRRSECDCGHSFGGA